MHFVPMYEFRKRVERCRSNHKVQGFSAIIKKRLNPDADLYTILQILSVSVFEQVPIL